MFDDFVWIQTRDESPTLWNNSLAEPFRSFKGAFTESWTVFIEPCLKQILSKKLSHVVVGEFGLGPGTNWLLMTSASLALNCTIEYFSIEHDDRSFTMGIEKWRKDPQSLINFLSAHGLDLSQEKFEEVFLPQNMPKIIPNIHKAKAQSQNAADFWFHDPFGFAVNPEGYSRETLNDCEKLWSENVFGVSYACNKHFQSALESLGRYDVRVVDLEDRRLKRSRLEFSS